MATIARDSGDAGHWEQLPLSSLYSVKYGKANPGGSGSVPVIGSSGVYAWTEKPLILHPTVVIGRKGSAGQAWLMEAPSYPSDTTFYLEPHAPGSTDIKFTYFALRHFRISASDDVIPSLQRHEIENVALPYPPVSEQRAIAVVLAKIQAAVEVQEKVIASLKELKAATMAKLFREGLRGEPLKQTEIGEIPESWTIRRFGEFATLQRGYDLPVQQRVVGSVPVIGSNGIVGYHNRSMAKGPGVATGRSGTIGLSFYCETDFWPLNTALFVVDFHGNDPLFIHYFFERFDFQRYAAGVSVPTLNRNLVHDALIAVPTLEEQTQIVSTIRCIDKALTLAETRRDVAKLLFSSMLHLLMTGRVRVTRKMIALQALEDRRKRRPKWSGKVDEKVLEEVVKRIVEAVAPERIILFGSAARGEMGPDSDLDLLVVKACEDRREAAQTIRRQLIGIGVPKDVVVVTPEDVEEYKDIPGYIIGPALKEGKVLYAA